MNSTAGRRGRIDVVVWICIAWLALLVAVAVGADWLPLADPSDTRAGPPMAPPSWEHWLGTDHLGRDLLARAIYGSRVSLTVGVGSAVAAGVVGGTIGLVAGYTRRGVDAVLMFACDVLIAFPAMLLAVAFVAITDTRGLLTVIGTVSLLYLAPAARLIRARTIVVARRGHVLASVAAGARTGHVISRSIVPLLLPSVWALVGVAAAGAMVVEGALGYLNPSVEPPTPTWGGMMAAGVSVVDRGMYPVAVPSAMMLVTVLAVTMIGDRLQSDPDQFRGWR